MNHLQLEVARYHRSDNSPFKHWYYLGAALFLYGNWQLCTIVGIWLGQQLPDATGWGLDFAMSVTFIGMVVPDVVTVPMLITVLVSGIMALLAHALPHQLGLLVAALTGAIAGFAVEQFHSKESQ